MIDSVQANVLLSPFAVTALGIPWMNPFILSRIGMSLIPPHSKHLEDKSHVL